MKTILAAGVGHGSEPTRRTALHSEPCRAQGTDCESHACCLLLIWHGLTLVARAQQQGTAAVGSGGRRDGAGRWGEGRAGDVTGRAA